MVARQALAALLLLGGCGGVGAGSGVSEGETKGEDETQGESEEFPGCDFLGGGGEELHTAIYTDESAWIYSPRHIVADTAYVYFADGRGIYRVLRCGGEAEELFPGARPFNDGLAIADGALYWIQGGGGTTGPTIVTAPVSGGDPVALVEYEGYSHRIRVSGGERLRAPRQNVEVAHLVGSLGAGSRGKRPPARYSSSAWAAQYAPIASACSC